MMIPRKSVIIFNLVKICEDIFWLIGFLDFSETQTEVQLKNVQNLVECYSAAVFLFVT